MIPQWLRIFLAGFIGATFGGALSYRYTDSASLTLLGIVVGFVSGYILYAPISFAQTIPVAWKRARERKMTTREKMRWSTFGNIFLTCTAFLWLAPIVLILGGSACLKFSVVLAVGMWLYLGLVGGLATASTLRMYEYRAWKKYVRRFNFFALPFTTAPYFERGVRWLIPKVPGGLIKVLCWAGNAIASGPTGLCRFMHRFLHHLARLTAENGRLISGGAAAVGIVTGLCLNRDLLFMSCVGGGLGLATHLSACLALRFLPGPQRATINGNQ